MNKNELINYISKETGFTKTDSASALEAFIKAVGETLRKGDEINLIGFGKFYTSKREATVGRNPQTGEKIDIPASVLPKFKAGKVLKDLVS